MTRLFNDPADFAEELTAGFAAANQRWVHRVTGGVIRSTRSATPTVAVITGGGSGHYPAFAGYVGQGLAHGAAMGNLFASPSAQQIHSVATAADRGAGVLFCYGNYAGDVLHFTQAQDRLIAEGIPTRTVTVTDDVSSASVDELGKRRGIAGDVPVLKVAGAAAEAGYDLDAVVQVVQRANFRTRSYGVAFAGCTLPGADAPLFEDRPGGSPWAWASTANPASASRRSPPPTNWPATWSPGCWPKFPPTSTPPMAPGSRSSSTVLAP
jgi:dihydroxyacetone kinase